MIYLVTTSSYPYGLAATKRTQLLAEGMNRKIKCKVIVCQRIIHKSLREMNNSRHGLFNNVEFEYSTKNIYANHNILKNRYEKIYDAFSTCRYLDTNLQQGDYVYVYMRDNFMERLILNITHKHRCKCVRELCELPYGTGTDSLYMRIQRFISLKFILPKYDAIFAISSTLQELAKKNCRETTKVEKIPILIKNPLSAEELKKRSRSNEINLFHAGALTQQKDGILFIFEALGKLKEKYNISFPYYLTGKIESSPVASQIKGIIAKYGLDNIHFLGYISDEDVEQRINDSTFLILYKTDNLQNKYCFATKLGEYLKNGKVVITTNVGEQINYLKDKENCLMIQDGDVVALVESIKWIVENEDSLSFIEKKALQTSIDSFDYISNTHKLINTLRIL